MKEAEDGAFVCYLIFMAILMILLILKLSGLLFQKEESLNKIIQRLENANIEIVKKEESIEKRN